MTVAVRRAETEAQREEALEVRYAVFVEEQGVPENIEIDGKDDEAIHFVGYATAESTHESGESDDGDSNPQLDRDDQQDHDTGKPVAAGRLRGADDDVGKVERIAVLESHRGEGFGRAIMNELEATARGRGLSKLLLHAQIPVEEFYHALGYETTSTVFEEAGIEHVEMEKLLK